MAKSGGGGGGMGAGMFAMSAISSVVSILEGYNQNAIAKINASLIESRGRLIDVQRDIEAGQYRSLAGRMMSDSVSASAASGVAFSGSRMAVAVETARMINIDKAIGAFGFEIQKSDNQFAADQERVKGKQAVARAYGNAFSQTLQGASNYAQYKNRIDTSQGAKRSR